MSPSAALQPRVIAVDWSGARRRSQDRIRAAEAANETVVSVEGGRDREQIGEWLMRLAELDPRLVVGLDFAFSFPHWFLHECQIASAPVLWALMDSCGEDWLRECRHPFWGRPNVGRPSGIEHFRLTEREAPSVSGVRVKSVFQIGGAGAVGTGSVRGMRLLHRLHSAGFAIWPFDGPSWPRVVEIYPRLLTGAVNKSDVRSRVAYLRRRWPLMPADVLALAAESEDAFDAVVSALVMSHHQADLAALPTVRRAPYAQEGIIWHPHWRDLAPAIV